METVSLPIRNVEKGGLAKTIVFMNFKGGVTKTTSCEAVANELYNRGYNVLIVDGDPQANLTRRIGVSRSKIMEEERSIAQFYYKMKYPFTEKTASIPYIIKGNIDDVKEMRPVIGLLAGEVDSTTQANATRLTLDDDEKMSKIYKQRINFYGNYFDYILFDTAPSITDNSINDIIISIVDNIIIPVDGIEAASGIPYLLNYIRGKLKKTNIKKIPNVFLMMSKYGRDSADITDMLNKDTKTGTTINGRFPLANPPKDESRVFLYRLYKTVIPEYIFDNGIPELRNIRDHSYTSLKDGSIAKHKYSNLTDEIIKKINNPPVQSLLKVWVSDSEVHEKILNYMLSVDRYTRKGVTCNMNNIRFTGFDETIKPVTSGEEY